VADIDDMAAEYLAGAADALREAGALDVTIIPTLMKRGRPGLRLEVLARPADAGALEARLFRETTTIGVRRRTVERQALERTTSSVQVLGHSISVKIAVLPDGTRRAKPEFLDVQRVSLATGQPLQDIFRLALTSAERA
jgi:pyridinium-3,5-bisthiocarboxylic acid mononucleotide nickel chelatase